MAITKRTPYFDIEIIEGIQEIRIIQRWRLSWFAHYSLSEMEHFKARTKTIIESEWSDNPILDLVQVNLANGSRRHSRLWKITFELNWVDSKEHWLVKLHPSGRVLPHRSSVNWSQRIINLDLLDTEENPKHPVYNNKRQIPVAHEFFHTLGNIYKVKVRQRILSSSGDEYKKRSPYIRDKASLMNIGVELRERHIEYILIELEGLTPGYKFQYF